MQDLTAIQKRLQEQRQTLLDRFGIEVVGIFGSRARGEARSSSDLDLLIEIRRPISLLELVDAELYLSNLLGLKVDLVPKRSLRQELRDEILREAVPV